MMAVRAALAVLAAATLAACASGAAPTTTSGPAPERRLERPVTQPPAPEPPRTGGARRAIDAGEAALLEGEAEAAPAGGPDDVVVPGQVEIPYEPPADLDTRTAEERARDIRAWDNCVMRAQRRFFDDSPGASPVQATPEELCSRSLGMASRTAAPRRR